MNAQIGENAGKVWKVLGKNGETATAVLAKSLNLTTDSVTLALGWLARENKVSISAKGKSIYVGLTAAEKKIFDTTGKR